MTSRRALLTLSLLGGLVAPPASMGAGATGPAPTSGQGPEHDFDYFIGSWTVRHRRLRQRLAGNDDWETFDGTTVCRSLFGGLANMNESVSHRGGGTSHGLGLRAYDPTSQTWNDWSLSGGDPSHMEWAGAGRFVDGVGTFLADDTFAGKPIKVRGRFRSLGPDLAEWDQAFSPDGGATWEVNWVMRYARTA